MRKHGTKARIDAAYKGSSANDHPSYRKPWATDYSKHPANAPKGDK